MAIKPAEYQLRMALDVPETPHEQGALSLDEIRLRSETARMALESGELWPVNPATKLSEPPVMMLEYYRLCAGGWPWRVALYICWLATPKKLRKPSSQEELATRFMGLGSDRVLSMWRTKNPVIDALARDIGAAQALEHVSDAVAAMVEVASRPDYKGRGDRELLFKMSGLLADGSLEINDRSGQPDLTKLSWEEKLRLAGLDTPEKVEAYKRELAAQPPTESSPSLTLRSGENEE